MPASTKLSIESLITMLKEEMAVFGEDPYPLLSYQLDAFKSYYSILREDEESLAKLSKQRRSERTRMRDLLTDIFVAVGAEVFVLCTFVVPMTSLGTIKPRDCIPSLRTWWKGITPRPRALELAVRHICETYSVGKLVSSVRKGKMSNVTSTSEQCPDAQSRNADQVVADTVAEQEQGSPHDNAPSRTPREGCSEGRAATAVSHVDEGSGSNTAVLLKGGTRKRRCPEDDAPLSKRLLQGLGHIPKNSQYCSFAFTDCRMVEEMPERLRTGIKTSKLWKEERQAGGLEVTNCLTMILPEQAYEDAFFVVRLGYDEGFGTLNSLGLGDWGIVGRS